VGRRRFQASLRYAQAAERDKSAFLFTPDFPAVLGDIEHATISNVLDPIVSLTAIARATKRIGFVTTGSTTFQEPFNVARRFKAVDVISHGVRGGTRSPRGDSAVALTTDARKILWRRHSEPTANRTQLFESSPPITFVRSLQRHQLYRCPQSAFSWRDTPWCSTPLALQTSAY
jgi:hypothetical protein